MKKTDNKCIELYDHPEIYYKDNYSDLLKLTNKRTIIVSTSYHKYITGSMATDFIDHSGENISNIGFIESPGAFELPLIIKMILSKHKPDIILALGCIIKGDTKHDEYLSSSVINGLKNLSLEFEKPIINGVLTTNTEQQAIDRAGIKFKKGSEYAKTRENLLNIIKTITIQ
jgi:6,7-dimethyl-8-ribityllumazine synthase